jgi:hypothetical protein
MGGMTNLAAHTYPMFCRVPSIGSVVQLAQAVMATTTCARSYERLSYDADRLLLFAKDAHGHWKATPKSLAPQGQDGM